MAYPAKLLSPGETVKFELKPHWRALFVPAIVLLATVFGMALLYFWIDSNWFGGTLMRWVVLGVGILIVVLWAIRPFLRWVTTEYVFTDRRIIVRSGIITREGRDMPLAKVNDVSFGVPAMGRLLNYGELRVQSAGENEGLNISDVPDVEDIQRDVYKLIEADEQRRRGTAGPGQLPPNDNA
ncbi:MAG: PH domain-containing protein [Actinomycetes bacterium]